MKHLLLLIATAFFCSASHAQQDTAMLHRLESFVKNIQTFNHMYQQEKVYLHFDNTGYFIGESIWFKAYVTTASHLQATPMSRVLYVELLDLEGNVMNTQKLCITDGQADGAIPLTRLALKSGFYEVRAYTRLMLNWDDSNLFSRVFPIFEKPETEGDYEKKTIRLRPTSYNIPKKRAEAPSAKKLNVEFFPEGGQLVNGITSTLAFKVTDKEGRPQEAAGCICNAQGDTVSVFSTVHEGMGSFIYTPDGGKSKIWIRSTDEKKGTSFTPPAADTEGCVMQVQNLHPEQVRIQVLGTPEYASVPMGITAMCRGRLSFFTVIPSISGAGHSLVIPKSNLLAGVNQLTLFTPEGKILAERLVYISGKAPSLNLKVMQEKQEYKAFEQINMQISVSDAADTPVETTLSMAVQDNRTAIPSSYQENILTNLLLSSDLKGYISNPGYYFESTDRPHLLAMDLLMLTQGFRRYSWQQMAGVAPFQPMHKIEKGLLIDGSVKSITRKKVQENVDVKMTMFSDSGFQRASCPTDNEGNFNYMADDFFGKWKLQMETQKDGKRKEYWITMDRVFSPQGRPYSFYDTYIPAMQASKDKTRYLLKEEKETADDETLLNDSLELEEASKDAKALKELVVKGKKERNSFIEKGLNIVYDVEEEEDKLEDQASGYNEPFFEFFTRINPFFSYEAPNFNPRYKGRRVFFEKTSSASSGSSFEGSEPGIATMETDGTFSEAESDNMIETKEEKDALIAQYNSSDVESIAIIESPATYYAIKPELVPELRGELIVLVMLKLKSNRAKAREPIGVRMTSLQGFSLPRDFYNPNYSESQLPKKEDFRRTLYWNPNVKTNSEGKASVSFFNNATCREMNISAETMTPDGTFGSYREE